MATLTQGKPCQDYSSFPINRSHQRLATKWAQTDPSDYLRQFPINRRHQRLVTPAPRAVAAHGHPKAFANSPILALLVPIIDLVENLANLYGAIKRAAPSWNCGFEPPPVLRAQIRRSSHSGEGVVLSRCSRCAQFSSGTRQKRTLSCSATISRSSHFRSYCIWSPRNSHS